MQFCLPLLVNDKGSLGLAKWSPTGKAHGTSIEIPSYAKDYGGQEASYGYPSVAKSTEASSFEHMNNLATFYAFIHGESPRLHAEVRFACLREAPPPEALRRAGATAKAGHAGVVFCVGG